MSDTTITAEQIRAWMEEAKNGTDNPEQKDGKEQYEAVATEYEVLLDALGIGSGQLDARDQVALIGVALKRVFGP